VTVLDAAGARRLRLPGGNGPLHALAFSPEGRRLFAGGPDGTVLGWDLDAAAQPAQRRRIMETTAAVTALAFAPGGLLAIGDRSGHLALWTAHADRPPPHSVLTPASAAVAALAFAPDGTLVVATHADGRAAVAHRRDPAAATDVPLPHPGRVTALALSADGTLLAAAAAEPLVLRWALSPAGA
jgi:WD40 repeat protein